ncbi:MAG TPA: hypothetical protein VFM18_04300 [Methanosarcina sp.]|nr:hypothetical protein [Methanosarcina sp.]
MTDKELMKFAAIAIGDWNERWNENWQTEEFDPWRSPDGWFYWNPLKTYSDAFDLFVLLEMNSIFVTDNEDPFVNFSAWHGDDFIDIYETIIESDVHSAAMRAIVRVASEIAMKKAYNEKIDA